MFGRKKKFIIILGVVLVVVLLLALKACLGAAKVAMPVTTVNPTLGDLQDTVVANGTVDAEEVNVIFAPASGKLGEIMVAAGDAVRKGDVLISYDGSDLEKAFLEASLAQTKATASYNSTIEDNNKKQSELKEANTNIPVLEQQIADNKAYLKKLQTALSSNQRDTANGLAKESYELTKKIEALQKELQEMDPSDTEGIQKKKKKLQELESDLARNSYLSSIADSTDYVADLEEKIKEVQEKIADYEEYKARMESQKQGSENSVLDSYDKQMVEADKELANITFADAQNAYNSAKSGVCAAFDGIITEVSAISGSTVAEGSQLLTIKSSNDVKIVFSANKYEVEKLAIGQAADITISGNKYTGKVSKINRMATPSSSGAPIVGVEVHIDTPDDRIILGMDAKMTIYTKKEENALMLPVEAINADKQGDFVYVVENGVVVRKNVVCGISSDTQCVILEGITADDNVITEVMGNLEEGMEVMAIPQQQ